MKKIFVLISTLTIFATNTFAQSRREDINKEIEQIMKAREELFRSLLDDNAFNKFEDRFNDLVRKFEQDNFGSMQGAVVGEYDWRESDTHQILAIKVKQIKNKPLDIKIEKGFVRLKGDVEEVVESSSHNGKKISKIHFERSFSIPEGVDQTTPEFDNKNGELLIKFKKLNVTKVSPDKNKKSSPSGNEREPVGRDSEDPII